MQKPTTATIAKAIRAKEGWNSKKFLKLNLVFCTYNLFRKTNGEEINGFLFDIDGEQNRNFVFGKENEQNELVKFDPQNQLFDTSKKVKSHVIKKIGEYLHSLFDLNYNSKNKDSKIFLYSEMPFCNICYTKIILKLHSLFNSDQDIRNHRFIFIWNHEKYDLKWFNSLPKKKSKEFEATFKAHLLYENYNNMTDFINDFENLYKSMDPNK